jgi:hypothetical protein
MPFTVKIQNEAPNLRSSQLLNVLNCYYFHLHHSSRSLLFIHPQFLPFSQADDGASFNDLVETKCPLQTWLCSQIFKPFEIVDTSWSPYYTSVRCENKASHVVLEVAPLYGCHSCCTNPIVIHANTCWNPLYGSWTQTGNAAFCTPCNESVHVGDHRCGRYSRFTMGTLHQSRAKLSFE